MTNEIISRSKCIIIDDEPLATELLTNYISRVNFIDVKNVFHNAIDAFNYLQNNTVDLIFLDIEMPELKGLDFLKSLTNPAPVIFTTAHRDYAVEGFELNALDYLVKPISFDRFLKAINKFSVLKNPHDIYFEKTVTDHRPFQYFKQNKEMIKVYFDNILWIESMKDYVKINIDKKVIVTYKRISYLEQTLPHNLFVRVHKSFIIAINKVSSYNYKFVKIANHQIPIGKSYRKDILTLLSKSSF